MLFQSQRHFVTITFYTRERERETDIHRNTHTLIRTTYNWDFLFNLFIYSFALGDTYTFQMLHELNKGITIDDPYGLTLKLIIEFDSILKFFFCLLKNS